MRKKLGGPKDKSKHFGNKHNLKHGAHERIIYDLLDEDEKKAWDEAPVDRTQTLKHDLRLTSVRIYKMMKRIQILERGPDFVEAGKQEGIQEKVGHIDLTDYEHVDKRIAQINDQLTKLQAHRARVIAELTKIMDQKKEDGDKGALDDLIKAIDASTKMIEAAKKEDA